MAAGIEIDPLLVVDSDGNGMVVRFEWTGDRYRHVIQTIREGVVSDVLRSVESDSETDWPLSPPLQQLSVEPIDGANVALGVGAAGRGYWSCSISPQWNAGKPSILVDVALRTASPADFLGSTYDCLSDNLVVQAGSESVAAALEPLEGQIRVVPVVSGSGGSAKNQTTRWLYRVELGL